MVSGIRMVRAYGREEYEISRAAAIIDNLYRLYAKSARVQAASSPLMEMLGGFGVAAVIWYGGMEVLKGNTTPGAFISFVVAMIMAYRPTKVINNLNTYLQEGLAAAAAWPRRTDPGTATVNSTVLLIHTGAVHLFGIPPG